MTETVVPTLAPEHKVSEVLDTTPAQVDAQSIASEKNALLDSIAQDVAVAPGDSQSSTFKAVFAGFLWFGYAVAIVVALVLVWSALNGLMNSLPH